MRTLPIDQQTVKFSNFKSEPKEAKVTEVLLVKEPQVANKASKEKKVALVSAAVAIASLGVSVYALRKSKNKDEIISKAKEELKDLSKKAEEMAKKAEEKASETAKKAEEVAKKAEENAKLIEEKQKWNDGYHDGVDKKINDLNGNLKKLNDKLEGKIDEAKRPVEKNLEYVDGFTLLQNLDNGGRRIALKPEVIRELQATSPKYMNKMNFYSIFVLTTHSSGKSLSVSSGRGISMACPK